MAAGGVTLDPTSYSALAAYSGQMQHWAGSSLVNSPIYPQAPDNLRRVGLLAMMDNGSEIARRRFLIANPSLLQQVMAATVQRKVGMR
jgi:hypothetical protein